MRIITAWLTWANVMRFTSNGQVVFFSPYFGSCGWCPAARCSSMFHRARRKKKTRKENAQQTSTSEKKPFLSSVFTETEWDISYISFYSFCSVDDSKYTHLNIIAVLCSANYQPVSLALPCCWSRPIAIEFFWLCRSCWFVAVNRVVTCL